MGSPGGLGCCVGSLWGLRSLCEGPGGSWRVWGPSMGPPGVPVESGFPVGVPGGV